MSDVEQGPLAGHEHLTMHDQMRAQHLRAEPETSPLTGAVQNRRREFLKDRIQARMKSESASLNFSPGENATGNDY